MVAKPVPRVPSSAAPLTGAPHPMHLIARTLVPLLALAACAAPSQIRHESTLVAHRGASFDAPENTLAAFELAWERGATIVEGDFFLSVDGEVVCTHDKTTGRFAQEDIQVAEATLAELRVLDVGSWKDAAFAEQRMPTLSEVLETVPSNGTLYLEVKAGAEVLEPARLAIEASGVRPDQVMIISFHQEVISAARTVLPNVRSSWITGFEKNQDNTWSPSRAEVFATLAEVGADGLCAEAEPAMMTTKFVAELHQRGYSVNTWTVNSAKRAQLMANRGVDTVTTDRPGWLAEQLGWQRLAR